MHADRTATIVECVEVWSGSAFVCGVALAAVQAMSLGLDRGGSFIEALPQLPGLWWAWLGPIVGALVVGPACGLVDALLSRAFRRGSGGSLGAVIASVALTSVLLAIMIHRGQIASWGYALALLLPLCASASAIAITRWLRPAAFRASAGDR